MGRQTVTLKEIAEHLKISTATVSRALNDRPGVSSELRQEIIEVAQSLGYRPDSSARGLATSMTQTVAFVVHQSNHDATEDPFYPRIMAGAESYLAQHEYNILLVSLDDQTMARPHQFSIVSQNRADGLILAGPEIAPAFILAMQQMNVPVVLVDNCLGETAATCVLNDDAGGAYAAAHHLVEHGHRQIVFLSGPRTWVSNEERARGYRRAMEQAALEPLILYDAETTIASGERLLPQALESWPDLTAICAVNDSVAIGALRAAAERGKRAPRDLCVIGFDDISWAQLNAPPLSTVHVFKRRIGELAAERLMDCITQPDAAPVKTHVSTELILRRSCCPTHQTT